MKRDLACLVYGSLDLLLAALYTVLFLWVVPSRVADFTVVALGLSALLAAAGVGLLSGHAWGRRLAAAVSAVMLAACAAFILLLVASAAYLHGIYGGVGQVGAALAIIVALLAVEVVGLVPLLQLVHLWRRRGRPGGGS